MINHILLIFFYAETIKFIFFNIFFLYLVQFGDWFMNIKKYSEMNKTFESELNIWRD